ncbi:TIGR02452 family protein [Lactobacillus helveticus]|uniref:TIGR02452 family protein n=1 Tax=Lactobacillus helveticus TaxID=1587 RepID=UPI00207C3767|nr:TIGR02452 family protein [Lactobacillus helveticus]MCO0807026.1 TIGR02452 family protein [Lactobacillus helveticus]
MYSIPKIKTHNEQMTKLYTQQIRETVDNTTIYDEQSTFSTPSSYTYPQLCFMPVNTATAIKNSKWQSEKKAALNFADYLEAGGGYLRGSVAQEEALCLESNLYQCLAPFEQTYYQWNNAHINHSLYENRALYSPNILFASPEIYAQVDIITCAAPNYSKAKLFGISYRNACITLQNRMSFVKQIAEKEHVAHLILGAWGAGVFGFKAKDVAQMWHNVFNTKSSIKKVTFAVIDDHRNSVAQDFRNEFTD